MKNYAFVDADAHVEECDETWEHLDPEYRSRRPVAVTLDREKAPARGNLNAFWLIDGKVIPQPTGKGASVIALTSSELGRRKPYSRDSQELRDVNARLRDMDKLGIDLQVVFPTIFVWPTSEEARFEAALARSYNSWMADICRKAPDRLKWNAVTPIRAVDEAVQEVKRAKALGAVGAVIYGTAGDRLLNDPSFDPFYAALCAANLPLCVHVGAYFPGLAQACDNIFSACIISLPTPVFMGFYAFAGGGILDRFPDLRVGFFEVGSQWVPYLVDRMDQYYEICHLAGWGTLPKKKASEYLREGNLYITCEAEDRLLPYVLQMWGEDRVMLASDIPHVELRDTANEEIFRREDLSETVKRKLLVDNALKFYGIR